MQKSKIRMCMYEGCTSKGKSIIGAHALQENRLLNKLAVNNKVLMQDFNKEPEFLEIVPGKPEPFYFLREVKIKDATVATCFCNTHDNDLFEKIEKSQYSLDTLDAEQQFLFAYKTLSFELYTEIAARKYHINVFKNIPQVMKNRHVVHQYRINALKLEDLQYYNDYFNKALREKDYTGLETVVLEIPFRVQFANYMTVAPPFDLHGKKIKNIDKKSKRMRFVFFTTFPVENKSYILVSALKSDMSIYGEYFDQIRNAPLGLFQYYINTFIPLYSQNLIVSPALWSSWTEKAQGGVQYAVADPHSTKMLKGVQFYMQNVAKARKKDKDLIIDSSSIAFDFFIPYTPM